VVLYDASYPPSESEKSVATCNGITINIRFIPQPAVPHCQQRFRIGERSGDSKAASLMWFVETNYTTMWHIEDDV
jgi:hypothetical protein